MGPMEALMAHMVKSKGNPGYVVFVQHQSMPVPMTKRGPAEPTRELATAAALEMLDSPVFTQAWTVGRDGIREVTR